MAIPRWTVKFGSFTFESTTKFSLRSMRNQGADGKPESIETIVAVEGVLVGVAPDPALSATEQHIALRQLIKLDVPQRLTCSLDGVARFDFQPSLAFGSPILREIVETSEGAGHATHVKYALSFWIEEAATNKKAKLLEIDSTASYYNDHLLQQTWHVKAVGKTLADAKSAVMDYKPSGIKPLFEQYHQSPKNLTFEATWTYDKTKGDGILNITESVHIENSGHPKRVQTRVGTNAKPAIHRGKFNPGSVTITFSIEVTDPTLIERPSPHFVESAELTRDRTREPIEDPAVFDSVRGLYRAQYTEFWLYLGTTRPDPAHKDDHEKPFPERSVPKIKDGVEFR